MISVKDKERGLREANKVLKRRFHGEDSYLLIFITVVVVILAIMSLI